MASLQEQIDTLRERVVAVQGSLATRALTSAMITLNTQISADLDTLTTTYTDLSTCVTELQDALLAARQELMDLKAA
jgi:hypothetical protein